jgi:hypothetical protein
LLLKELGEISAESIEDCSFDARDLKLLRLPPHALPCALLGHHVELIDVCGAVCDDQHSGFTPTSVVQPDSQSQKSASGMRRGFAAPARTRQNVIVKQQRVRRG